MSFDQGKPGKGFTPANAAPKHSLRLMTMSSFNHSTLEAFCMRVPGDAAIDPGPAGGSQGHGLGSGGSWGSLRHTMAFPRGSENPPTPSPGHLGGETPQATTSKLVKEGKHAANYQSLHQLEKVLAKLKDISRKKIPVLNPSKA